MRETIQQLAERGWKIETVPFEVAIGPDHTVGMRCMTCPQVIKGVMVAHGGLVVCRSCAKNLGAGLVEKAGVNGFKAILSDVVIRVLKHIS